MAISKTLAAGMMDVAGNAMLAHAVGEQVGALADANDAIREWMQHAANLEARNAKLQAVVEDLRQQISDLIAQRDRLAARTKDQSSQLAEAKARMEKRDAIDERNAELFDKQVRYTRDLKVRLAATERALKDSSARSAALGKLQEFFAQSSQHTPISDDYGEEAKAVVDKAQQGFMQSGQLSPDPEIQRVLDELKLRAPDRKEGLAN